MALHLIGTGVTRTFWWSFKGTEILPVKGHQNRASLFSQAGLPALVLGPGNIAQAHTVDEWVDCKQLQLCYNIYQELLS